MTLQGFEGALPSAIQPPLFKGHRAVPLALAFHQPVVSIEQGIRRQVLRVGFINHIEVPRDHAVAETKIGGMQQQQAARLQAPREILDHPVKSGEVKQGIAALGTGGSQVAIHQHRQTEDRVIRTRGFALRRRRDLEGHILCAFRSRPRQAASDVARIYVDSLDRGGWEILAQAKDLFAAGATKRQYAEIWAHPDARGRESKQPRISIGQGVIIGLEFSGDRPPEFAIQRITNVPELMAASARNSIQYCQIQNFHCILDRWQFSASHRHVVSLMLDSC
jgi:hypothetical protein